MPQRIGAGYDRTEWGLVNTAGLVYGTSLNGPTAGDANGEPMKRLRGSRTLPVTIPEPERVPVTGDNEVLAAFQFPGGELPNGILEVAVNNMDFNAIAQGTKVRTMGGYSMGSLAPNGNVYPTMCLNLLRQTSKQDAGETGLTGWEGVWIPRCTLTPLNAEITERTFNPYRYAVNINPSDRAMLGYSFTEGIDGATSMAMMDFEGDYPPHQDNWKGNAVRTAFTLSYTPVTATDVMVALNGVLQTYTAHYTVAGNVLTMLTAPGSNIVLNSLYGSPAGDLSVISS